MQVISDLHGGDPEDLLAKAEFQEIKDKVQDEVILVIASANPCSRELEGLRRRTVIPNDVEEVQATSSPCHVFSSVCSTRKLSPSH